MSVFDILIWSGAGLTLAGLLLLVWCIARVIRAKRSKLRDEDLRVAVQKVLPLNLAALFISMFGLMLVIVGIFMG